MTEAVEVIVDDTRSGALPEVWSPSSLNDFIKCPLAYWWKYAQGWKTAPTAVLSAGSLVHAVLEELLALESGERTIERARQIYTEQWSALEPELDERINRTELRERAGGALAAYFELEDPSTVELAPDGLERKTAATLAGVPIAGTADRVEFGTAGARVVDYKTGAAKPRYAEAYWRQVLLYAQMLTDEGIDVSEVALMHLGDPARLMVRPVPDSARTRVVGSLARAAEERTRFDESAKWQARPSALCGWCPFQRVCPAEARGAVPIPGSAESHRQVGLNRDVVLRPSRSGALDDEVDRDDVGDPEEAS